MYRPRSIYAPLLSLLLTCFWVSAVLSDTIDMRPKPAFVLRNPARVLVQNDRNSVALYNVADGTMLHQFSAAGNVEEIAVSADERWLLVVCGNGSLGVWNLLSMESVWWRMSKQSGLVYPHDANFAWDGKSFVIGDSSGKASIFSTQSGALLGRIGFPPGQTSIMSAALAPDGSKGILVTYGEQLFTFDLPSGAMKDTGLKGAWPIRYSADGKYASCRDRNSGRDEKLRIVSLDAPPTARDIGGFPELGLIKPDAEGGFLVTAACPDSVRESETVGMRCCPATEELTRIWLAPLRLSYPDETKLILVTRQTDFSPDQMIGVTTDYCLRTVVIDLRTGRWLQIIDNSASYQPDFLSSTFRPISVAWIAAILVSLATAWYVVAVYYRRRKSP